MGMLTALQQGYKLLTTPRVFVEPPDGGRAAWSTVAFALVIHIVTVGFIYTVGIFATYWLQEPDFGEVTRADVSWAASICYGSFQALGVVSGRIVNRWGTRTCITVGGVMISFGLFVSSFSRSLIVLYATFSVFVGGGCCLGMMPALFTIQKYFKKRRSTATGIAVAGTGLGGFVLGPLVQSLVAAYGWRSASRLLALMGVVVLPICSLPFVPVKFQEPVASSPSEIQAADGVPSAPPTGSPLTSDNPMQWDTDTLTGDKGQTEQRDPGYVTSVVAAEETCIQAAPSTSSPILLDSEKAKLAELHAPALSIQTMLRSKIFALWLISTAVYGGSWYVVLAHMNTFAVQSGFDPAAAASLASFQGAANLAGRLVLGVVSDRATISRPRLLGLCVGTLGVFTAAIPWLGHSYAYLAIYMMVNGFAGGSVVSMQAPVTVSLVGLKSLPVGQGLVQSCQAPFVIIMPVLAGWITDNIGTYTGNWLLASACMLFSASIYAFFIKEQPIQRT